MHKTGTRKVVVLMAISPYLLLPVQGSQIKTWLGRASWSRRDIDLCLFLYFKGIILRNNKCQSAFPREISLHSQVTNIVYLSTFDLENPRPIAEGIAQVQNHRFNRRSFHCYINTASITHHKQTFITQSYRFKHRGNSMPWTCTVHSLPVTELPSCQAERLAWHSPPWVSGPQLPFASSLLPNELSWQQACSKKHSCIYQKIHPQQKECFNAKWNFRLIMLGKDNIKSPLFSICTPRTDHILQGQ